MITMSPAIKRISGICARHQWGFYWEELPHNSVRARIPTLDRIEHAAILKAAHRLRDIHVTEWFASPSPVWEGCISLELEEDFQRRTAAQAAGRARLDAWWTANHAARLQGMGPDEAAAYADLQCG